MRSIRTRWSEAFSWTARYAPWDGRATITGFEGTFETTGPEETEALGAKLGKALDGGEVIALCGELGSGKTVFVRGLARGMGVEDPDGVRSPSYTLMLRYQGPAPLLHLDAYFMRSGDDLALCGLEDALAKGETVVIEWADRVADRLTGDLFTVRFEHCAKERRRIRIRRGPPRA